MKNLLNLVKIVSVAALFAGCAYEKDPGLQPKAQKANTDVSDKLKGLATPDVLKLKYKTLSAQCSLAVVSKAADPSNPADDAAPPVAAPPAPAVPVKNEGEKTTVDLKAQAVADPKMQQDLSGALMEVVSADRKLSLSLTLKPLAFDPTSLTLKVDKLVYVMKYSPVLTGAWSYTETLANGDASTTSGMLGAVHEQVPFTQVVRTEKKAAGTFDHVLTCVLKGDIDDKNADVQGQWIKVDCSGQVPTKVEEKAVYEQNCKPKDAPQDAPPAAAAPQQ